MMVLFIYYGMVICGLFYSEFVLYNIIMGGIFYGVIYVVYYSLSVLE